MTDISPSEAARGASVVPDASLVSYTHWMYALHALSAAIGVFSAATVVGQFIFGIPSIVAVVMNYVRRSDARGTYLESHFTWQLNTFWFAVLWFFLAGLFSLPLVLFFGLGIVTWVLAAFVVGVWIVYRVARGWLRLKDGMPVG
jgi:uncharacterized membrane protein